MAKWVRADAKAWPQGYSGMDAGNPVFIGPGAAAPVTEAKAAQLAADFPGAFAEITEKEAEKLAAEAAKAPEPAKPAKAGAARKDSE